MTDIDMTIVFVCIFAIMGMMFAVIGYDVYQDITEDKIEFTGTIEAKNSKEYNGGFFGGGSSDYYFTINTSNTSIVKRVSFDDYARHSEGDIYNYTLGTKREKDELSLLKKE